MSVPPSNLPSTSANPVPVAKARRRTVVPAVQVNDGDDVVETRSPWELHGWAASLVIHFVFLLILGLWYFALPSSQVKTLDARLAGSDLGSELGMMERGGLDTPVTLPDAVTLPTETSTLDRMKPIDFVPDPNASMPNANRTPGAGAGDGFGLAKFGSGGESIKGVEIKVGDPQFTLLWDSNADIDLHVIEPGGKEIYWNDTKGRFGGELDVDNVEGFGPENVYWLKESADGSKDLGPGPPGEYRWFVVYYGGNRGIPVNTTWRVRVKHAGKAELFQGRLTVPKSRSRTYTLKVGESGEPSPAPTPTAIGGVR